MKHLIAIDPHDHSLIVKTFVQGDMHKRHARLLIPKQARTDRRVFENPGKSGRFSLQRWWTALA